MPAETLETEIAGALRKRIAVISDSALRQSDPAEQLNQLRQASERISELALRLPPNTHPQLRHYFERCSYDKALAWIEQEGLADGGK